MNSSINLDTAADAERFRLFVSGVTDYAIYMLSPDGTVITWNAGAQRFKGYTAEEIIGQHFSRFYSAEDRAQGLPMHALNTSAREGSYESEGWRIRKDGSRFWAHVVIDPIRNDQGELIGFAKVTRDITERHNNTQALEKAQEALFQAQKLEAIGKLTGGVAHDFNNLLSVIVNGIAILRREVSSEHGIKILDTMERAVNRGENLNQQLLSFARQQPLKQEKQNLNRIIESFETVLRRANLASVTFNIQLNASSSLVMVDAAQFEAALLNLIVNSRDAIAEDGSIVLETESVVLAANEINQLPAGNYIKITVTDTGQGMPAEIISRAIEPFFTTKPPGRGTGLGLSQVYGFLQQSKGDLVIHSTVGQGTGISLFLPTLDEEESKLVAEGQPIEKALIVDDQPDVLDMATELFRTLGYEVISVNNAEDALKILERVPNIEVLFSDIVMPGMSGVELGQKARALKPDLHILLASGYTGPALVADNAALKEFQFINKPYRIADVVKKLRCAN